MTDQVRLAEDKLLRDAARELVTADVARLKAAVAHRSVPARAVDRATEGAADVLEQLSEAASRHKGVIAGIVGAAALWLARHPLLALLDDRDPENSETPTPEEMPDDQS